jgi:hypothetical protein
MNSRTTLNKVKPFLPPKGVQLDCLKLDDGWSRMHRWAWESQYPQWAEEYGENPLIFQALELPDAVINAAAERLFDKPVGFGMGRFGICQTHMQIIAAAIFYAPDEEIQIGGGSKALWRLYIQAKAVMAEQRREATALKDTVALFG